MPAWNMFAAPGTLTRFVNRIQRYCAPVTLLLFAAGYYYALIASPQDYQQGEYVRIMYIHVPAAWWALGIYCVMAGASLSFLVWRHAMADIIARASALPAIIMASLTLITGSLWGKPTWGVYWVWDARLTSMLLLLFILLGYHMLARQSAYDSKRQKACAVFCLFGGLNIPIIKFSVDWWATLHQPASILRSGGSAVDASMATPLFLMALAYGMLYLTIMMLRVNTLLHSAKARKLRGRLYHHKRKFS